MDKFEQYLREEFLENTQNYPDEYHNLFQEKFCKAKDKYDKDKEKEVKYKLIIKYHKKKRKYIVDFDDYATGINAAITASAMVKLNKWTRHPSIDGILHHMDFYSDMFNEGIIVFCNETCAKNFL